MTPNEKKLDKARKKFAEARAIKDRIWAQFPLEKAKIDRLEAEALKLFEEGRGLTSLD